MFALADTRCVWTTAAWPDAACAAATEVAVFAWAGNAVWMDDRGVCVGGYAVGMDDRSVAGRGLRRCYRGRGVCVGGPGFVAAARAASAGGAVVRGGR